MDVNIRINGKDVCVTLHFSSKWSKWWSIAPELEDDTIEFSVQCMYVLTDQEKTDARVMAINKFLSSFNKAVSNCQLPIKEKCIADAFSIGSIAYILLNKEKTHRFFKNSYERQNFANEFDYQLNYTKG